MKKLLTTLVAGALLLSVGIGIADEHEGESEAADRARPVEAFACRFKDGKGLADLDPVIKKFNAWADKRDVDNYWAWTLVPYYFGPEQEFDILWLGASLDAAGLGRIQDAWLSTGTKIQEGFDEVLSCDTHGNWAALTFKKSPERTDPSSGVISFSDCKLAKGMTFEDVAPALTEWGEYRTEQGSKSGMFVFFPAYGGGGEKFDFKWINSWQNLEELGVDYDQYATAGWKKANELFAGKLDCDSSRAYLSTTRRMGKSEDE